MARQKLHMTLVGMGAQGLFEWPGDTRAAIVRKSARSREHVATVTPDTLCTLEYMSDSLIRLQFMRALLNIVTYLDFHFHAL